MNQQACRHKLRSRRDVLRCLGAAALVARRSLGEQPAGMNIIRFEETLAAMRRERYRHPPVDIIKTGFRPIGGNVADFCTARHAGRHHFFYIERRLQEGTPFYPGHEIYFGHASTANFFDWEVYDPVLLVRPDTWEDAHVWAPSILPCNDEFVMAYTGVNHHLSQNIGLASSQDLFTWKRWDTNPISPCKGAPWAFWRDDGIASCRDPHLFRHDGRIWMIYTANTRDGASCIALAATDDLRTWRDHGPILIGPNTGYEPRLQGGHPQGSLESAHMVRKRNKWFLVVKASIRGTNIRLWVFETDRLESFDFAKRREFWPGGAGVEVVKDDGNRSLLACFAAGCIRFGQVDWADPQPAARFLAAPEELTRWQ